MSSQSAGRRRATARAALEPPHGSPIQAALWGHPAQFGGRKEGPRSVRTGLLGLCLAGCLLLEMATEGQYACGGLLSARNGLLMKFLKSLHAINITSADQHVTLNNNINNNDNNNSKLKK